MDENETPSDEAKTEGEETPVAKACLGCLVDDLEHSCGFTGYVSFRRKNPNRDYIRKNVIVSDPRNHGWD